MSQQLQSLHHTLEMKLHTLTGEIVIVKADQKQARQCYVESLKVALYPPIRDLDKLHPPFGGSNSQIMSVDEEFQIKTLAIYGTTRGYQDDAFDVDLCDDTIDKCPKPIEELVKLQLGLKLGQYTQLSRDLTSHEYKHIVEVL